MREIVTSIFIEQILPKISEISEVAIVGGNNSDPEVIALKNLRNLEVTTFGIDPGLDFYLDLNSVQTFNKQYDLVICSQVLEHIYDVKNAIHIMSEMTRGRGFIWIACPASNRSHGSPDYYSAGYQPELIANLAASMGLQVICKGLIGSKRGYFFTHALRVWPTLQEHQRPITKYLFSRSQGSLIIKFLRFVRDYPGRFYSLFQSSNIRSDIEYATEMYIFLTKVINSRG